MWPYSVIRSFNFNEPGKFSFISGNQGPFGVGEYNFEVHDVKALEYTLKQFIGTQISQSRSKPQPYYYPQCQCAQEKNCLSDSVDSRSVFMSHGFANKVHSPPLKLPGPTRDYLHLPAEINDPLSLQLTGGGFPLRHSFSTGDLLESTSSSSSYPPRQVSHKTHVRLFVSLSGEGPCIVEDEQHQSNSRQCHSDVRHLLAHPKTKSIGRLPTVSPISSSSSVSTQPSPNNPKNVKQQMDCCSVFLPAHTASSQSPYDEILDLSVTPKQATPDDFNNVGYLPRSSPLVSRSAHLKVKSKMKVRPTQRNQ
jgi:hypothetical protein